MHRALLTSLVILVSSVLVACGGGGGEPGDSSPSRVFLSMGTAPPGGAFFCGRKRLG